MFNRVKKARSQPEAVQMEFERLVEKAMSGDTMALSQLCEGIAKSVLFQLTHILGNQSGVEDVSQEVLIRVCENIRSLRNPKAFRVWLGRIIINEKNRYLAKTSKRGVVLNIEDYLESILEEKSDFLPQEYAESDELHKVVMDVISNLPMRQREAIMLHYYNGMSVTEIAQAMEVTTQSVSKHLALAREKLRNELRDQPAVSDYVGAMGALPAGALLATALQQEGARFAIANPGYIQAAMAKCGEYIMVEGAIAQAASVAVPPSEGAYGYLMCAAGVVIAAAVFLAMTFGGPPSPAPNTLDSLGISFTGGPRHGEQYVHLNPEHARMYTTDADIRLTPLNWWITLADSDVTLLEGYGDTVGNALIYLRETGRYGEHFIFFQAQEDSGIVHKVGSNFYIQSQLYE